MVVEAVSSISNKGMTPQITFGKKHKETNQNTVTSPLKAVPVAVLIAMSPVNETKAVEIMHPETVQAPTELVQNQTREEIIYSKAFSTEKYPKIDVMAVNSKGHIDGFDKIKIKIGNYVFNVKSITEIESYLLSANGVKEGPVEFNRVKASLEGDDKIISFVDDNITNYVKELINRKTNISDIINKGHLKYYLIPNFKDELLCCRENSQKVKDYLSYEPDPYERFGTLIPSLTRDIQGTYGKYKIRFYDRDGNNNNYEKMTVQKEGEPEFKFKDMSMINVQIRGIDTNLDIGNTTALGLCAINKDDRIYDEDLTSQIINILEKSSDNNRTNNTILHKDSYLIFTD